MRSQVQEYHNSLLISELKSSLNNLTAILMHWTKHCLHLDIKTDESTQMEWK